MDEILKSIHKDDPFRKYIIEAIEKYLSLYGEPFAQGRNRICWRVGQEVLKIPVNEQGVTDNEHEACYGESYLNGYIKYARCRRVDEPSGLPALWMEYCIPWYKKISNKQLPDWTGYVDCCQVGFNPDGELVAYDYGFF